MDRNYIDIHNIKNLLDVKCYLIDEFKNFIDVVFVIVDIEFEIVEFPLWEISVKFKVVCIDDNQKIFDKDDLEDFKYNGVDISQIRIHEDYEHLY